MKIAIPISSGSGLNSSISEHFGRAEKFLIVDFEGGKPTNVESIAAPEHAYGAYPEFLHDLGVNLVVCDSIGSKARELLENLGITVIDSMEGKVAHALRKLEATIAEMEEKEKEEEERRKKAMRALEKARERTMNYYLDIGRDSNEVFLCIKVRDDVYLSFDLTRTGPRVILQQPNGEVDVSQLGEPEDEYETLHFLGTRLLKREKQRWWLVDGEDIVEGTKWKILRRYELSSDVEQRIREFADLIRQNLNDLSAVKDKIKEFNNYLYEIVQSFDINGI